MIEYAVRKHFPDLPDTTGPSTYSRNYLEKLIQVPFRIPALGDIETRLYVTLLLVGTRLGENDPAFLQLISAARERLKRQWTSAPFDAAAAKGALGDQYASVQSELFLSEQIGPTLASGTNGNPRQIKRFVNAMMLRERTAQARGFGDEVRLPILAKLMLAERFLPHFFDQIASTAASSTDGRCPDLTALEALSPEAKAESPVESVFAEETPKPVSQPTSRLREWQSSAAIQSWAQVHPPVGEVDLRPTCLLRRTGRTISVPPRCAADTRISRVTESQDSWTREMRLVVPLSDLSRWSASAILLERMLNFLTGDCWKIGFRARPPRFVSAVKAKPLISPKPTEPVFWRSRQFDRINRSAGGRQCAVAGESRRRRCDQ